MTDYLNSVKTLVERLNLQASSDKTFSNVSGKKMILEEQTECISGKTLSETLCEVKYRHKKNVLSKKKSRADSSDSKSRRRSFYQVIKLNKGKLCDKHYGNSEMDITKAMSELSFKETSHEKFQYNVSCVSDSESECNVFSPALTPQCSPRSSQDITGRSLFSPRSPFNLEPSSSKTSTHSEGVSNSGSKKFEFQDEGMKSPDSSSSVLEDLESSGCPRKNNWASRPRLSVSKSMPLSPPSDNAERAAKQRSDFQLKLDTLKAELLAMRKADQELAKKLLNLYSEIQVLKVKNSCMNYSELLDEAMYEAEMADELPDMCDAPQRFTNKLLTSHGVTSFNIHSRRFSCS